MTRASDMKHVRPILPGLKGVVVIGGLVVGVFFVGFGGWAAFAPLSSAAIAPGVISADGYRRSVQHLEGGIVDEILVREGDQVKADQVLVRLKTVQAEAEVEQLRRRLFALMVVETRLQTELEGGDALDFSRLEIRPGDDKEMNDILSAQRSLFQARRASFEGQKSVLRARVEQLKEQIAGLEEEIASQDRQIALIEDELVGLEALFERGNVPRTRILALQREQSRIEGERARNRSSIASTRERIGETEFEILSLEARVLDEISTQLTDTRAQLSELREQNRTVIDRLERTQVRAPISGTVVAMQIQTEGGVIGSGEPLMDIVPTNEELLIDARVAPTDVDVVEAGLTARITLSAFKQRNLPQVFGEVRTISADRLVDEQTGLPYYLARVRVNEESLDDLPPGVVLSSGMPAEVMIVTEERTVLDYLIDPFKDLTRRGMREG